MSSNSMVSNSVVIDDQGRTDIFAIEPPIYIDPTVQSGFTPYAEKLNGRLAMIGFVSMIGLEILTGHGVIGFLSHL
nr:high light inducible protein [Alkalinema sp. FACHB-956]